MLEETRQIWILASIPNYVYSMGGVLANVGIPLRKMFFAPRLTEPEAIISSDSFMENIKLIAIQKLINYIEIVRYSVKFRLYL